MLSGDLTLWANSCVNSRYSVSFRTSASAARLRVLNAAVAALDPRWRAVRWWWHLGLCLELRGGLPALLLVCDARQLFTAHLDRDLALPGGLEQRHPLLLRLARLDRSLLGTFDRIFLEQFAIRPRRFVDAPAMLLPQLVLLLRAFSLDHEVVDRALHLVDAAL